MKKNKILIILVILTTFFILSIVFSLINIGSNKMFSGIYINNVNISNMTKNESTLYLENLISKKTENEVLLKYISDEGTYEKKLDLSIFDLDYTIDKTINSAYNIGRKDNIFISNFEIAKSYFFKNNFTLNIDFDEKMLNNIVSDISSNLPGKMIQSGYYVENKELIITKGSAGVIVDKEQFKNELIKYLTDLSNENYSFNIPVIYTDPKQIDIDVIHSEIHKEAHNAYYEEDPFKVYPEVVGIDFDVLKSKSFLINNPDSSEITIELNYTYPKTTLKNLKINIFPDELSTFFTQYDENDSARATNLNIAASKIDGTIVMPGEEFSYNKIVGARSISAGYKEAKIYQNGQVVDGLGGGICQISSTLYNAVVCANLEITERFNHQFVTSYVKPGCDATVAYGSKDFKFRNNRTYPIRIDVYVANGMAKVDIYGINEQDEKEISVDVETVSTIEYDTRYISDSLLASGTEVVKQRGADGVVVNSYKITKQDGVIISKELLSKDTYKPLEKIIAKNY